MQRVLERAGRDGVKVVKWCLLEVLERCPQERDCMTCPLWEDCRGVAKNKCDGFVAIDDAIAMKRRVSRETWESEMMCRRPSTRVMVFPSFDTRVHVREIAPIAEGAEYQTWLGIDFGFSSPFVCLWIRVHDKGVVHVIDEYVQPQRMVQEHIEEIEARNWGPITRIACDPAGVGRNDQTSLSNVELLRAAGYLVRYSKSRIVDGLELIRAGLRTGVGEARLFIHPRCKRLTQSMQNYHYPDGGAELPVKDGENDHLVDALRYFYVNFKSDGKAEGRRY